MPPARVCLLLALFLPAIRAAFAQETDGTLPTVVQTPANTYLNPAASTTLDLSTVFALPTVTGPVVQFQTVLGNFNVELYNQVAPLNCANFLAYVNSGAYANTIVQRSVSGFVIQGGGYTLSTANVLSPVQPNAAVKNEYQIPNTLGTMAMALPSGNADGATTNWFFNLADNSSYLDNNSSGGGPFTVFAHVLGTGMSVINAIAALPTYNITASLGADFASTPLIAYSGSVGLVYADWVRIPSIAVIPIYPPNPTTPAVLAFTATSSNPSAIAVAVSGHTLTLTAGATGGATLTVVATDTNGNQATTSFSAGVTALPVFTAQPAAQTVAPGATVVFSAAASGYPPPTYQWSLGGRPISGATSSRLLVSNAGSANAGSYTVTATNAMGAATSSAALLTVAPTTTPGHLVNLSILSPITGTLTMGFVNGGAGTAGSQSLLLRAIGPSLTGAPFNVPSAMTDPTLTLIRRSDGTTLGFDAGWGTPAANAAAVMAAEAATGAFPLTNVASLDSALVESLPAVGGGYSVVVAGRSGDSGNAITEVYDADSAFTATSTRLINLSCITTIAAGGSLDVGFVLGGTTNKTLLIRVSGPTLATFGQAGTMADPQLEVTPQANGADLIAANAGWAGDPVISAVAAAISAFPFTSTTSKDSAVVLTLPPGVPYTVGVNSASGGGGAVLVEIYEVP